MSRRWKEVADDALAREEAFAQHDRRYLHTSVTLAGMVAIDGLLDPEGGEALLAALEAAGGPTDLGNLVLLCRRHHVLCHEGGWQLSRCPDGTITATPPNHGPPRPRGPDLTLVA